MPSGIYDRAAADRKRAAMVAFNCRHCGRAFEITESSCRVRTKNSGPPQFCSRACMGAAQVQPGSLVSVTCDGCGCRFLKGRTRIKPRNFCSRACMGTRIAAKCDHCGKEHMRRPDQSAARAFCSRACANLASAICISPDEMADQRGRTKAYMAAYLKANREGHNARCRAWAKANPEKRAVNQRARRANRQGRMTAEQWRAICELYRNVCVCCWKSKKLEADHVIPVSLGGTGHPDNFQPLCRSCNASKGATAVDYRPMFRLLHGITVTEIMT